ncbi:hypothetical protein AYI70_g7020 [Smittium culicis]|uniref:Uncharacterized protein n=1 Tax=Smittium culicis TaxID=133412 RepID=A0A1R1XMG5_9FUNG|nr:hypothetical protein AYI70_g7020 [Smittium culicis]
MDSRKSWRIDLLNKSFQQLKDTEIQSFFSLSQSRVLGHHSIKGIKTQSLSSVYNGSISSNENDVSGSLLKSNTIRERKKANESILSSILSWSNMPDDFISFIDVKMNLKGAESNLVIYNSNGSDFPITVPVYCNLENLMWCKSYKFKLRLVNNKAMDMKRNSTKSSIAYSGNESPTSIYTSMDNQRLVRYSPATWNWGGLLEMSGTLHPKSKACFELKLICYTPGCIDLSNWELQVIPEINENSNSNHSFEDKNYQTIFDSTIISPESENCIWVL